MSSSSARPNLQEAPPEPGKDSNSNSKTASSSSRQEPPRLQLEGSDIAGEEISAHVSGVDENEDDPERLRELERLRAQLQRSELNRSPHGSQRRHESAFPPGQAENTTPEALKSSQRSRRRVQWVGLSADDEFRENAKRQDSRPSSADRYSSSRPGHVSVSIPSTPQTEIGEPSWPGLDGMSDGMQTSGFNTPDASRPGTPEEVPNIPPGERDGLPLPSSSKRGRTFTREAARLVAVHKAKTMFKSKAKRKDESHNRSASNASSSSQSDPRSRSEPVMLARGAMYDDEVPPSVPKATAGGGVLSALLKLYEQPQSERSSQATLVPSSASTPPESSTPARGPIHGGGSHRAPEELPTPIAFANEARRRGNLQLNNMFSGSAARKETRIPSQPSTPKLQDSIFGALQQSTAAMTGAASPASANAKSAPVRPNYSEKRHSMPDIPTLASLAGDGTGTSTPLFQSDSKGGSPERPLHMRRKTGSSLALNQLAKVPEQIARSGEKLARESLDPKRFHRESAVLKAAKSRENSPSTPGTPKYEYDEKTPVRRRKKDKKRQDEIFITMHVAAILQRQDFILRFARALMMFGAPPHRIEYQLQQTAKVLQIECQVIYIVNFMIISFSDAQTHTSEIRFIKQLGGLDLTKLTEIAILHWEVVHDKIGVEEASVEISNLMKAKPTYNDWQLVAFGSFASAMIGIAAFNVSFIDLLIAMPLGGLLVTTQCFIAARSDVLSSIFEIVIAAVISFVSAALASTTRFCYAAVTSASIVLILPGWPTCLAALELQSRSLVSGSVRIVYAVVYSLFLGFGISLGANVWQLVSGQEVYTSNDNKCTGSHPVDGPWYQQTIPQWFYFLAVPGFPLCLSLRNHAKPNKELLVMVLIAGCGWTANHFSTYGFPGRSDISSALGAFTVGVLSNLYGKLFQSTAFIVAATPIMFQLPSGLGNGGLLNWATTDADDQVVFSSGWSVAQQLIQVVIGLVVGLLFACAVIYPFGKRRGGLMTF